MKNINFKKYKFSQIIKHINKIRYNFIDLFKFIDLKRYILRKFNKYSSFRRYDFRKFYKYLDIRRYNLSIFYKYLDIRRYNLSKFFKYFGFKYDKKIPIYFVTLIIFTGFLYLAIPIFYSYEKAKIEKVICNNQSVKCSIEGKIKYILSNVIQLILFVDLFLLLIS